MAAVARTLHQFFLKKKKTLAFAESCTGGMMAQQITKHSGASKYFLGSLVVYADALKKDILGVSPKTLRKHGSVSKEVVEEMLEGLFRATSADFGIAVSGIAGPTGGTKEKPVGTIWAAIGQRGKAAQVVHFKVKGNRKTIILSTTKKLFGLLAKHAR